MQGLQYLITLGIANLSSSWEKVRLILIRLARAFLVCAVRNLVGAAISQSLALWFL